MDGQDKTRDVAVSQQRTLVTATTHAADVTHLCMETNNMDVTCLCVQSCWYTVLSKSPPPFYLFFLTVSHNPSLVFSHRWTTNQRLARNFTFLPTTTHSRSTHFYGPTHLYAKRHQGGSDCVTFSPVRWPLVGTGPLAGCLIQFWPRLLLLPTVHQHGLDAVSVSQEEGVALARRHIPSPKIIG